MPDLNHISFLYVEGCVSIPETSIVTKGFPSVEAIAIPPPLAVVSVERSTDGYSEFEEVVTPRIISLSVTLKSCTLTFDAVPPIERFPVTVKSPPTLALFETVNALALKVVPSNVKLFDPTA